MSDRTFEVHCRNCAARFTAWYGDEDADTEMKDVEKCGLAGATLAKRDNFKDAVLRLIPYVTARNSKRDKLHDPDAQPLSVSAWKERTSPTSFAGQ
jgi:hypothetical protein